MIELVEMSDEGFERFKANSVIAYAKIQVDAGRWAEEGAEEKSREHFENLLPADRRTPFSWFFDIIDSRKGTRVGFIYFGAPERGD